MKHIKKLTIIVLLLALMMFLLPAKAVSKVQLEINGQKITYDNGEKVMINAEYERKSTEFRAVWVSPATNDIAGYTSMQQYKEQIYDVLDKMDYYNLNVMIFHVRIMNDAIYKSKYNKWSVYYNENPDWDALPWIIEECHKRGIEFHAWMNPYRVTNNVALSLEELAKRFDRGNPASNPKNMLRGSASTILNPGLPEVQSFLVDTCMELIENYDVDAIHFDDYFYTAGIDDSDTHHLVRSDQIENWRRDQVSAFIEKLSKSIDIYNNKNNRRVQLGIAPPGVYKNGNGVVSYDENNKVITNGSATRGYAHYGAPLYADTLKWIENEWIDYILPQTYHAITLYASPYCDLVSWWDKVMKYSRVNLYASIGYYMNGDGGGSWNYNKKEAYDQALFCNTMEYVKGTSIYNFTAYSGGLGTNTGLSYLKDAWGKPAILPEIHTSQPINVEKVNNFEVTKTQKGNKLSFEKLDDAKFYVLYKSTKPITFSQNEVFDIIGNVSDTNINEYVDNQLEDGVTYYYGVKAQSYSLRLGPGVQAKATTNEGSELNLGRIPEFGVTEGLLPGETVTVHFRKLLYPFGDEVKYEITYSFDDQEAITSNQFYMSRNRYSFDIQVPLNAEKLNVKVKAYNNLGSTTEEYEAKVSDSLPKINNFGYVGTPYSDVDLQFVWNTLPDEDITNINYTIQYSSDGYVWNNLNTFKAEKYILNMRVKQKPVNGRYFYRVVAEKQGKYSYSDIIELITYDYLGDFNIKINGKELADEYEFASYEKIDITWNKHNEDAVYTVYASNNLANWISIKNYASKVIVKDENNQINNNIELSDNYYILYIKITGLYNGKRNESQIIKIKIYKDFISYDEFSEYISTTITNGLTSTDLFK